MQDQRSNEQSLIVDIQKQYDQFDQVHASYDHREVRQLPRVFEKTLLTRFIFTIERPNSPGSGSTGRIAYYSSAIHRTPSYCSTGRFDKLNAIADLFDTILDHHYGFIYRCNLLCVLH